MRIWETQGDYRRKATRGVALAAMMLLLPFTIYALICGLHVVACGGLYITAVLVINTQLVARGINHEPTTLYALVPGGILFMSLAFGVDGYMASVWCFPSILACYCMLGRNKAIIANVMIMTFAVPMMWITLETLVFARLTASLTAVSVFASILVREIDSQQRMLRYQLDHDPLTGLLNRTSLKARLEASIEAFHKHNVPATLLAFDLDHFKQVNDRYGHDAGDQVLCEVARLLTEGTAKDGDVFRLGGEEFLVLLAGMAGGAARQRAERLRESIASSGSVDGHPITASVGVAVLRASDDRSSWARRSDERLFCAKRGGRNRVVTYTDVHHGILSLSNDRVVSEHS